MTTDSPLLSVNGRDNPKYITVRGYARTMSTAALHYHNLMRRYTSGSLSSLWMYIIAPFPVIISTIAAMTYRYSLESMKSDAWDGHIFICWVDPLLMQISHRV